MTMLEMLELEVTEALADVEQELEVLNNRSPWTEEQKKAQRYWIGKRNAFIHVLRRIQLHSTVEKEELERAEEFNALAGSGPM